MRPIPPAFALGFLVASCAPSPKAPPAADDSAPADVAPGDADDGGTGDVPATGGGDAGTSGGAGTGSGACTGGSTGNCGDTAGTTGTGTGAGSDEGGTTGTPVPDFRLADLNPNSVRAGQDVSPRDYMEQVSGWYFIHST
ncbi:MAG: hypothetical protein VX265_13995 [Myxococcota bacterium]|nr:hypothetical protein [Myxococcota bacterium]